MNCQERNSKYLDCARNAKTLFSTKGKKMRFKSEWVCPKCRMRNIDYPGNHDIELGVFKEQCWQCGKTVVLSVSSDEVQVDVKVYTEEVNFNES